MSIEETDVNEKPELCRGDYARERHDAAKYVNQNRHLYPNTKREQQDRGGCLDFPETKREQYKREFEEDRYG